MAEQFASDIRHVVNTKRGRIGEVIRSPATYKPFKYQLLVRAVVSGARGKIGGL